MAAIAIALGSCGSNASEASGADSVAQADSNATTYNVDAASSTVTWFGTHAVGTGDHNGTINIKEGSLSLANGNITAIETTNPFLFCYHACRSGEIE